VNARKPVSVFETSAEITRGLDALLSATSKRSADNFIRKVFTMQDIYLGNNPDIYIPEEIERVQYYLRAVSYKFQLANLSLEQLWALSETKREELYSALENSLDRLDVSDDELLLISFAFEGVLFQVMACLEFYMLYLCFFLQLLPVDYRGKMTTSKFFGVLAESQEDDPNGKVKQVEEFFNVRVFGTDRQNIWHSNNWGTLVISLRDKIAHRDRLRPSFDSDETLIGQVLFDWPTLRGITYDRFYQSVQSGLYCLIKELSPILYELEWKPGPRYEC
jgi:hypothetical protein